jgi:HSP20 family protein
MAETEKTPAKAGKAPAPQTWHPLATLQREVDRIFDDFNRGTWRWPFAGALREPAWGRELTWGTTPAVDVAERDDAYEITAELPGMDEKDIELTISDGMLTIKGEKSEEKEEKKKDYYVSERRFGSFERSFSLPEGVDADKIEAAFSKGVLTVTMPKRPEAQKPKKKIAVKAS